VHKTRAAGLIPSKRTPPLFRHKAVLERTCARYLALAGWTIYVGLIFQTIASTWRTSTGTSGLLAGLGASRAALRSQALDMIEILQHADLQGLRDEDYDSISLD
jgi:hypothetical protein